MSFTPVSNKTTIYYWRHGRTEANQQGLLSGGSTEEKGLTDLTQQGKDQAVQLRNKLAELGHTFNVIYSSDMTRAIETATIVSQDKIQIIRDENFREICHGKWQMTKASERRVAITIKFNNEMKRIQEQNIEFDKYHFWKMHPFAVEKELNNEEIIDIKSYLTLDPEEQPPETSYQNYKRFKNALRKVAKSHPGEAIAVSGHGACLSHYIDRKSTRPEGQFLPPFFTNEPLKDQGEVVLTPTGEPALPKATRVENCTYAVLEYDHETNKLSLKEVVEL